MTASAPEAAARDALAGLRSGMRVFVGSGAATPLVLLDALCERGRELSGVEVCQLLTLGPAPFVAPELAGHLRHNAFFIGANVREAVQEGRADFTPVFLSEIPALLRGSLRPDIALVQVSPPDRHGQCSLGVSVDVVAAAVEAAGEVVAEINPNMPRTLGESAVPLERLGRRVEVRHPLPELRPDAPGEEDRAIGRHVSALVRDGDTLQLGIGTVPNAVLASLEHHKDLGIHTEMFSDGVVDLVERGVITGARKTVHGGKLVTSFVMGTRRLYDFVDDNPAVLMLPSDYVNDPFVVSRHRGMVAINSALAIDLTGQVCADSVGAKFYSGVGGQVDFVRGAARAENGRSIVALRATAREGTVSRIVVELLPGSGVTTTRNDVHFVVTEYGVAELRGRTVRQRVEALVKIAHPAFRESLLRGARARRWA